MLPGLLNDVLMTLLLSSCPPSQEKQDKAVLLAEMANLRHNNQRLQEESHSASEQLRKFSKLLSSTIPERKWLLLFLWQDTFMYLYFA